MKKRLPRAPRAIEPMTVGWREWVALPELGIKRIKAKIDTGARTSALHAENVECFSLRGQPMVRFDVYPIQHRLDHRVRCEAPLVDERFVTDSGGHREKRYVIQALVQLGDRCQSVEITLSKRDSMQFRMLLGRTALRRQVVVDPGRSYLLKAKKPRPSGKSR